MLIYTYDEHGAFVLEREARANPLEPGEFLLPRNATEMVPPDVGPSSVAVFVGDQNTGGWTIVEDNRGQVWEVETGSFLDWRIPGPLPDGIAPDGPPSRLHDWDDLSRTWVEDLTRGLDEARAGKSQETEAFALTRARVHMPSLRNAELMEFIKDLGLALNRNATTDSVVTISDYLVAKVAELMVADLATVEAYDPATDPGFPS